MNFKKIYENAIIYAKASVNLDDCQDKPQIRKGKTMKPAVKGLPSGFKLDKANPGQIPTEVGRKEYNVKYSKKGGLIESEIAELKKLGILKEGEFDDDMDFYSAGDDSFDLADEDDLDDLEYDPELDDGDLDDEDFDDEDIDFEEDLEDEDLETDNFDFSDDIEEIDSDLSDDEFEELKKMGIGE